ncbi:hypothetical protein M404DRAFT_20430 [Pisolithus tinctorius Marx 270]|uniref:Uncharacterized protein n=1 Tax=Pisolithus tinctorius Marx 270 TaxID=870435 RepID=A0A0C3PDH2_PISTI|nr:hypothetical protein M404DRAFT_20430 [Pisolithus tinctorius Marx 270]
MLSHPEFDQIDEVGESSPAEEEDVFWRPTGGANIVNAIVKQENENYLAKASLPSSTHISFHLAQYY